LLALPTKWGLEVQQLPLHRKEITVGLRFSVSLGHLVGKED
jgi:hypothetical protein